MYVNVWLPVWFMQQLSGYCVNCKGKIIRHIHQLDLSMSNTLWNKALMSPLILCLSDTNSISFLLLIIILSFFKVAFSQQIGVVCWWVKDNYVNIVLPVHVHNQLNTTRLSIICGSNCTLQRLQPDCLDFSITNYFNTSSSLPQLQTCFRVLSSLVVWCKQTSSYLSMNVFDIYVIHDIHHTFVFGIYIQLAPAPSTSLIHEWWRWWMECHLDVNIYHY